MVEHSAVNRVVVGSSPTRGVFRPHGQAVKTSPFHGGNTGSIPVGVIRKDSQKRVLLCEFINKEAEQLITNQLIENMPMWLNWQSS